MRKPESINAYIDMDTKDKVETQQQIKADVEKLLESAGWSRIDEIAYKWSGEEEISLGGDPEAYDPKADVDVNNYQILWAVSYKNDADEKISQISRLMLNVIAECLAECFGDVWHIVQAGKGDVELVKSRMLNKQIVFMEIYKKILFSQF